jgi:DNA-binding NarL/FixJ family response regulator
VLILTTFDLDEYVYDAPRAGASGFLLKDVPPEHLIAGIRMVHDGKALLAPSITRQNPRHPHFDQAGPAGPRPDPPGRHGVLGPLEGQPWLRTGLGSAALHLVHQD